eukprot:TRINITY_DN111278_c0_g1_i1.p1 TRINITY_DN111278_c0_g1~~TRINITY_DN111278_c0_g1_i1.p1  ORF type:complete len:302 (-),score=28.58 TRINITY_DN111278_c0_g1_i1:35-940(-)
MGDQLSLLWAAAPAVTRTVVVIPLSLNIANFFIADYLNVACGLSLASVYQARLWTIFTAGLWQRPGGLLNFLFFLLITYFLLQGLAGLERANGSGRLLTWISSLSVAINLLFLVLAQLLHVVFQAAGRPTLTWLLVPCQGLMPLVVFGITVRSLAMPDVETSFFFIRVKNRYYPLVLITIFGLMSGPMVLQDVAALILGFVYQRLRLDALLPTDETLRGWELRRARGPCGLGALFGRRFFGGRWVSIHEAGDGGWGTELGVRGNAMPAHRGYGYTVVGQQQNQGQTPFPVFTGSGQRLGSA